MCTFTLVLPREYPDQDSMESIRPLTESSAPPGAQCYINDEQLVWHNQGYYYLFSCHHRQLVLDSVSDFNPLIGCRPQPLSYVLNSLAMDEVNELVVRHRRYKVSATTGHKLLKELRNKQGINFFISRWAVKNYFGHIHPREMEQGYRELIALTEQAIIKPAKLILVADSEQVTHKSILLIDSTGTAFKCRLSSSRLRISIAAKPRSFSIHNFRNRDIKITAHCLERFATRILGRAVDSINPLLLECELMKFIKNTTVSHSFQLGKTVLVNLAGYNFVGAISRGKLNLVTVYQQTLVDVAEFQNQVLTALQGGELAFPPVS